MSGVRVSNRTKIARWAGVVGAVAAVTSAVALRAPASRAADQPDERSWQAVAPANDLFPGLAAWLLASSLASHQGIAGSGRRRLLEAAVRL